MNILPVEIEFSIYGPMICSSAETESRTYTVYTGKSGKRWLVANQPNAADNIYVEGGPNSDGFAGRTLSFPLTDGSVIKLTGPWHSNPNSLLFDTGIDIRDKCLTRGIVSIYRERNGWSEKYINILHYDEEPVVGKFERVRDLAQSYADELNITVYYGCKTDGGGSSGQVKPREQSNE